MELKGTDVEFINSREAVMEVVLVMVMDQSWLVLMERQIPHYLESFRNHNRLAGPDRLLAGTGSLI